VLARQAAEAAGRAAGNGSEDGSGNGHTHVHAAPAAPAPSARRSGTAAQKAAPKPATAQAAPVAAAPKPSGTGPELAVKGLDEPRRSAEQLQYSAPSLDASPKEGGAAKAAKTATVTGSKEPARNAPCPCGSGKKYKQCHGAAGR
jgi:preprotein translocase subunit SecA